MHPPLRGNVIFNIGGKTGLGLSTAKMLIAPGSHASSQQSLPDRATSFRNR